MFVLISYDIGQTATKAGRTRLRRVAKLCEDVGQRVQFSVFEVTLGRTHWAKLRLKLLESYDARQDSLRFYYLGEHAPHEHHGIKPSFDFGGPLLF